MIQNVGYFMSNKMRDGIYDSCKSVINPTTSKPALQMMCGIWGDYCDATKLFDFIGDVNAFSPFQISYLFTDNHEPIDGHKPNDRDLRTCADPIPGMSFYLKFIALWAPAFFMNNNSFIATVRYATSV